MLSKQEGIEYSVRRLLACDDGLEASIIAIDNIGAQLVEFDGESFLQVRSACLQKGRFAGLFGMNEHSFAQADEKGRALLGQVFDADRQGIREYRGDHTCQVGSTVIEDERTAIIGRNFALWEEADHASRLPLSSVAAYLSDCRAARGLWWSTEKQPIQVKKK